MIIIQTILLTLFMMTNQSNDSTKHSMVKLFPAEIQGWKPDGEMKYFKGDAIYDYINGAGEIYLCYNFNSVLVQRYLKKKKQEILLEIFDMGSSSNAFGIFTHTQSQGEELGIGQGAEYIPGLLSFWKDRYFICIRFENETPQLRKAAFAMGHKVAKAIASEGEKPEIIKYFTDQEFVQKSPPDSAVWGSIRYFFRYEILNQHFYVADKNILNLNDQTPSVLAQYSDDKSYILLVKYPNNELAMQSYKNFLTTYLPDAKNTNIVQTENGKWTGIQLEGRYVVIIFDANDIPSVENKFATIIRRIKE